MVLKALRADRVELHLHMTPLTEVLSIVNEPRLPEGVSRALAWWAVKIAPFIVRDGTLYLPTDLVPVLQSLILAAQEGASQDSWESLLRENLGRNPETEKRVKAVIITLREAEKTNPQALTQIKPPNPPLKRSQAPKDPDTSQEIKRLEKELSALSSAVEEIINQLNELKERLSQLEDRNPSPAPASTDELADEVGELRLQVEALTKAFNDVVIGKLLRAYVAGELLMVKAEKLPPLPQEILDALEHIHLAALKHAGESSPSSSKPVGRLLAWLRRPH